ncbi:acyltransferase [Segatella copri]|uniref:acyltransferase n=1 Tax=Segatella copri TaxID=165179 RepID=UPI0032C0A450
MYFLSKVCKKIKEFYCRTSNDRFISYLKSGGASIGHNVIFRDPHSTRIDMTRPWLVSIGNNVDINVNFQLLTHDWCTHVFRNIYHDFINSSGKVSIGNNVYIAANVIILKGVTIGNNCIIGAGSVITKNVPDNSVAVGCPCRVISSLHDFYVKRKNTALQEAIDNVKCYRQRFGKYPSISYMKEEFIYFVDKKNLSIYSSSLPIVEQLGGSEKLNVWLNHHRTIFSSYEDFLDYTNESNSTN